MKNETKNIRWLHLSDFHVGKDGYGQNQLFKYILRHLAEKQKPDFVFITGDIAQSGKTEHYEQFGENFLLPMEELLGDDSKIILVPGNHDVDRNMAKFISRTVITKKGHGFFDPTNDGSNERKDLLCRFDAFKTHSNIFFDSDWIDSPNGYFANKSTQKAVRIGILGINTAWFSEDNNDRGQLSPGKAIVEKGLEDISETDLRIVLGHHPIDWFREDDAQAIRALFGKNRVIYLHGHLHKNKSRFEEGAGYQFLNVQTGAAFQERENDIWVNGFTWGEWNSKSESVELEPYCWNKDHQEWVPDMQAFPSVYRIGDSTRFSFPIVRIPEPINKSTTKEKEHKTFKPPNGWEIITIESLDKVDKNPDDEIVLSYFDGRVPNIGLALCQKIPRRAIVSNLVNHLNENANNDFPSINILLGAGGEGKTTSFFQIVEGLLQSGEVWKVLFRRGEGANLSKKMIDELPGEGIRWLVASDDADLIADDLYQISFGLQSNAKGHVHFLLASRHTEWRNTKVTPPQWERLPGYHEENLRGLSEEDAEKIVDSWSLYNKRGLGRLAELPKEEAVRRLISETRSEQSLDDGAFLGALLRLRFGEKLSSHVKKLLDRLCERKISQENNASLLDAFAYIAAMHAENKLFLSKGILCSALNIIPQQLRSKVLWPLGEEAAADVSGDFVFTRHRAIAETAIDILVNTTYYDIDITEVYKDLVKASRYQFLAGEYVPNVAEWKYLSTYFFEEKDNPSLAITLAKAVLEVDVNDSHARVKLAQLFRKSGHPDQALSVFRDAPITELRGFFHEWAVAESIEENYAIAAYLNSVALADETEKKPLDNKTAAICLTGFAIECEKLFNSYNNPAFVEGTGSACQLGSSLRRLNEKDYKLLAKSTSFALKNGYQNTNLLGAIRKLRDAVVEVHKQLENNLPRWIIPVDDFTFEGLESLLGINAKE